MYEDDPEKPDNFFENYLSQMESRTSEHIRTLIDHALKVGSTIESHKKYGEFSPKLPTSVFSNVTDFVAYQYFRVPGANDKKRSELSNIQGTQEEKEKALRPGRMTFEGYNYAIERFRKMKVQIRVSDNREFLTSDWPCFDLSEAVYAPALGEEIGKNPEVVLYMPLSPHVALIMHSPDFREHANKLPKIMIFKASDGFVKNQNSLIVQQAERFVVASKKEDFVFQIAAKRKKSVCRVSNE